MLWRAVDVEQLIGEDHPAREVARRSEWEPALQWLTGCEVVRRVGTPVSGLAVHSALT